MLIVRVTVIHLQQSWNQEHRSHKNKNKEQESPKSKNKENKNRANGLLCAGEVGAAPNCCRYFRSANPPMGYPRWLNVASLRSGTRKRDMWHTI
jgi:hypothetical protein